jgi:hypothetical protein
VGVIPKLPFQIFVGFDTRPTELQAFAVAKFSMERRLAWRTPVLSVALGSLRKKGLYTRSHSVRDNKLWDNISDAPMSTEFAISRFLVPHLAQSGFALFVDGDVLAFDDVTKMLDEIDTSKAVSVVKHDFNPPEGTKMDGQVQTPYFRKNWSSVMLWNCEHEKVKPILTPATVNAVRGLWLHQFTWLDDEDIGELDPKWNYLVGHTKLDGKKPSLVHFTDGIPNMPGYEDCEYAQEWRDELELWAGK